MEYWDKQIKLARYMLLGTVIVTVLDIAFLLGNMDLYISYHASVPYYLVWLGKVFDNGLYLGAANGEFTATGLVMAAVLLSVWILLWWLSFGSRKWLLVGLIAVAVDLGVLVALSFALFADPLSCFWEAILHIAVLWEMAQGLKAWKQKEQYLARQSEAPVWEEEYV